MTFRAIAVLAMMGAAWPSGTAKETALDRYVPKAMAASMLPGYIESSKPFNLQQRLQS